MAKVRITSRQRDVLKAIADHWLEHQLPPSMNDLGEALGVTSRTAHQHVHALLDKGIIEMESVPHPTVRPKGMEVIMPDFLASVVGEE